MNREAHLGIEITPEEIEAAGGDLRDLIYQRVTDAGSTVESGLFASDDPDDALLRAVGEHIAQHAPKRGLRISILIHDPLTNP